MTDRVAIVGAGRAGRGLARALRASGVNVTALHARRAPADDEDGATAGELGDALRGATVVLVAVQDAALGTALDEIAAAGLAAQTTILQLSGSAENAVLDAVRGRGHPAGTMHPLVPLSAPERAPALLRGAWMGVAGDGPAIETAERLARAMGARTLRMPDDPIARASYHAGAVVASNFSVALAALAERLLVDAGVPADAARGAAWHLASSAIDNVRDSAPAAVLTGPVVRGDVTTVRRHIAALEHDSTALRVYLALTDLTRLVAAGRIPATAGQEIDRLVNEAERRLASPAAGVGSTVV